MHRTVPSSTFLAFLGAACLAAACATSRAPAPLAGEASAYERAGELTLPATEPVHAHPALHNVFRLSDDIISGAEPESEEALEEIAAMGVKTILSVDGKAPNAQGAARLGMRYVHVPIRYSGITENEKVAIVKTFRELDGPFYVHCFHGKHRGPAAAALGRVALDGAPRERAIAEMRQWCGTAPQYEGLYESIAYGHVPSEAETAASDFDFAPQFAFAGFRHAMIEVSRSWDIIEKQSKRDWQPDPAHPDANARNEAEKLVDAFAQSLAMPEVDEHPDDFRAMLSDARSGAGQIADALQRLESGDQAAAQVAVAAVKSTKSSCSACHRGYRN